MSSVKPGGPKFLGPTSWRPKFLRWLSPLLLVSLGLHGLGLLVPVPEKPEDIEQFEPEEFDPIAVSTLPPTLELSEPEEVEEDVALEPPPPPPPPEEKTPPPPALELPLDNFPFEEDLPPEEDPIEEEDSSEDEDSEAENFDDTEEDDSEENEDDSTKDDPSPDVEAYDDTGTNPRNTQGLIEFTSAIAGFDHGGPAFIRNPTYELEYSGDRCYENRASLEGYIAVLMDVRGNLQLGRVINSVGYGSMNDEANRWLEETAGRTPSEPSQLSPINTGLYGWLTDNHSGDWFDGVEYEAYYFPVSITLLNPCAY